MPTKRAFVVHLSACTIQPEKGKSVATEPTLTSLFISSTVRVVPEADFQHSLRTSRPHGTTHCVDVTAQCSSYSYTISFSKTRACFGHSFYLYIQPISLNTYVQPATSFQAAAEHTASMCLCFRHVISVCSGIDLSHGHQSTCPAAQPSAEERLGQFVDMLLSSRFSHSTDLSLRT